MVRAQALGLSWAEVELLSEEALEERLYGPKLKGHQRRPLPDPVYLHNERKKPGVTLELLRLSVWPLGRVTVVAVQCLFDGDGEANRSESSECPSIHRGKDGGWESPLANECPKARVSGRGGSGACDLSFARNAKHSTRNVDASDRLTVLHLPQ